MNGRLSKQIRKATKRHGQEYLHEIKSWNWKNRLSLAWWLVFGKELQ